eukprot:169214_1
MMADRLSWYLMSAHERLIHTMQNKYYSRYKLPNHLVNAARKFQINDLVLPFASNLTDILHLFQVFKPILRSMPLHKELIKSVIEPLLLHQLYQQKMFGFVAVDMLTKLDNEWYFSKYTKDIIQSLFHLLYSRCNNDTRLTELIRQSRKRCVAVQYPTEYGFSYNLVEIPMDTFYYLLT